MIGTPYPIAARRDSPGLGQNIEIDRKRPILLTALNKITQWLQSNLGIGAHGTAIGCCPSEAHPGYPLRLQSRQ